MKKRRNNMFELLSSLLLIASAFYFIYFTLNEGSDERGKTILFKSNTVCLGIILLGQCLLQLIYRISSADLESYIHWSFMMISVAFAVNATLILLLRKKY
jgi:hypothetical protein